MGSARIPTIAYHPILNGVVELFHRQLKGAYKAYPQWTEFEALPVILLGIKTAVKQDLGCSAAGMCYGTTLRLPGAFFNPQTIENLDPIDYVQNLKKLIHNLQGVPPCSNQHQPYIFLLISSLNDRFLFIMTPHRNRYKPHMMVHTESLVVRRNNLQ